ncbi:unnamed protein product [Peronospora belbahrii]|uniref:Uncharacterized protein n=1 Tax=Peronospora belbahrii TaxID=622444 RepID=A0AAU9KQT8_9STRA|nr:unnamed protein product [Peronospora belbahrii]CAH0518782.1 unnamed protein product [Peronospora belbahrii]
MRFKDVGTSETFLNAVALTKSQVLIQSTTTLHESQAPIVLVDQLTVGREDIEPLVYGDVAGIRLKKWHGTMKERDGFFTTNPLEIQNQLIMDATSGNEVRRITLVQRETGGKEADPFVCVLAGEALVGMQKMSKRLVAVMFPETQMWVIAELELVKVKKNMRSSTSVILTEPTTARNSSDEKQTQGEHDDLVKRMASLSRMGSETSGLMASVITKTDTRSSIEQSSETDTPLQRVSSNGHLSADPPAGYVPVLLAGLQLPGERPGSFRNLRNEVQATMHSETALPSTTSLAAKAIEPLKQTSATTHVDADGGSKMAPLSNAIERLMKEQSDLARLRDQLEESKRKLRFEDTSASEDAVRPSPSSSGVHGHTAHFTESKPAAEKQAASFVPSSYALLGANAASAETTSSYAATTSQWTPSKLDLMPSSLVRSFHPPPALPPAPFSSSITTLTNPSFPPYSLTPGVPGSGSLPDVESGVIRLQRSSTSIESTLQDLHLKVDRLLNVQNSMKSTKFVGSSSKYGVSTSFSPGSSSMASSSSSMLLKSLEKALAQRDQLQEANNWLKDANSELESSVEDLQNRHESLQAENRTLLDKLQNGNRLQQEKFCSEMRSVQQQLSHTQEQMLVYQEENFQMRAQLAAKDEQLAKEKSKLHEETQKQLGHLQRQVEDEVRQGSKDANERIAAEKAALEAQVAELRAQKKQWDVERDMMNDRLSQAQSQQLQYQDDSVKSQAAQNSRIQELTARVHQLESESRGLKEQVEGYYSEAQHLEELLASKEQEMVQLQSTRHEEEYAALSELFKEFMNDIYFHFQDAFDEETEFTGKEIVMAIRKILKQNTMGILAKLEEFYQEQAQHRQ